MSGVGLITDSNRRRARSISSTLKLIGTATQSGRQLPVSGCRRLAVVMLGGELPFLRGAEAVALEIDLQALAGMVIEIEQDVANRPPLERRDQARDVGPI